MSTLTKLNAALDKLNSNRVSCIDDKYKLINGGFDAVSCDADKDAEYNDRQCLRLAIKRVEEQVMIDRAMVIIGALG